MRGLASLLAAGLMVSLAVTAEPAPGDTAQPPAGGEVTAAAGAYTAVAEAGNLRLLMEGEELLFAVEETDTGKVWYATPPGREDDPVAKARVKQQMASMLLVTFLNAKGTTDTSASYTASVKKGGAKVTEIANGVRVTYTFESEGFVIPVELTLEKGAFQARVITGEIKETGENRVMKVELFPYFGAGGPDEEGYLLVPDGSGALIDFHNGKHMYAQYNEKVYGRDINLDLNRSFITKESIHLPVFGIKCGEHAMLGIITEGAASASIKANGSGSISSYNNADAEFELRSTDTYTMGETVGSRVTQTNIYQKGAINYDAVGIRYLFFSGAAADYTGMAAGYRRYLQEEKGMQAVQTAGTPLVLETVGAIRKTKSVLGLPVEVTQELTGYAAARRMMEELRAAGAGDLILKYNQWDTHSIRGKPQAGVSLSSDLGGKKAFKALMEDCAANGASFYPDVELQQVRSWGNGYSSFFNSAKTISGNPALRYQYNIATRFKEKAETTGLLRMSAVGKLTGQLLKGLTKQQIGAVSLGSAGDLVYSDFAETAWNRQKSADALRDAAAALRDGGIDVMASGANDYLLPLASVVVGVPSSGSNFDVADAAVPFLQIVLKGVVPFASTPANLSPDPQGMFLQAVETGAMLRFLMIDDPYLEELQGSDYTYLYSVGFGAWAGTAAEYQKKLAVALQYVDGQTIRRHSAAGGLSVTEYENGVRYLVNHTDEDAQIDGFDVGARDYRIIKGGADLAK